MKRDPHARRPRPHLNGRRPAFARSLSDEEDQGTAKFGDIDGQEVIAYRKANFYPTRLVASRTRDGS